MIRERRSTLLLWILSIAVTYLFCVPIVPSDKISIVEAGETLHPKMPFEGKNHLQRPAASSSIDPGSLEEYTLSCENQSSSNHEILSRTEDVQATTAEVLEKQTKGPRASYLLHLVDEARKRTFNSISRLGKDLYINRYGRTAPYQLIEKLSKKAILTGYIDYRSEAAVLARSERLELEIEAELLCQELLDAWIKFVKNPKTPTKPIFDLETELTALRRDSEKIRNEEAEKISKACTLIPDFMEYIRGETAELEDELHWEKLKTQEKLQAYAAQGFRHQPVPPRLPVAGSAGNPKTGDSSTHLFLQWS